MASEIRAGVTKANYAQVRAIVGGSMPATFPEWEEALRRAKHGTRYLTPEPPTIIKIDLDELRAFVKRTGQSGDTAIDNYAAEKAANNSLSKLR